VKSAAPSRIVVVITALTGLSVAACVSSTSDSDSETNPCIRPEGALISDFETGLEINDGGSLYGRAYAYPDELSLSTSEAALRLEGTVTDYAGIGFWFGSCVDASGYDGLVFQLSGTMGSHREVDLVIGTRQNNPAPPVTALGTCTPSNPNEPYADCLTAITVVPVTLEAAATRVRFDELSGGRPHPQVDPSQVTDIAFWLPWSAGPVFYSMDYDIDITLDNVAFYAQ
jgi:hypothetical protein